MKVLIKERHFVDRYSCNDIYREHTITRMDEQGDMFQLYNGSYPYMCVPKSDIVVLKNNDYGI